MDGVQPFAGAKQNGQPPADERFIELREVGIRVGNVPGSDGLKVLLIGPVTFALPLSPEAARVIVHGLTGIHIVGKVE